MPNYMELPAFNDEGDLLMVVQTPHASCVKLRFDPKMKVFSVHERSL